MSESRLSRIEDRVDQIKEDVSELKSDFKVHLHRIEAHIESDEKITKQIEPLTVIMPNLCEMVEDYTYQKHRKEKRSEKLKSLSVKITIAGGIIGIILGILRIFSII